MSTFMACVFGKHGCSKCEMLLKRLGELTATPEYSMFQVRYNDVLTLEGIMEFCKAESLNPNRIPALLIAKQDAGKESYIVNKHIFDSTDADLYKQSSTGQWLGVQTDYSTNGVISLKTIKAILDKALEFNVIVTQAPSKEALQLVRVG